MAVFGYLFVLTGFYFICIAVWKYRDRFYGFIGFTVSALAFFVGGVAKVYGIERNPTVVFVFLLFFVVAIFSFGIENR
jgi:uncharacterized membrane protein